MDAVGYYLKSNEFNKLGVNSKNSIEGYFKNHLNPFFCKFKFYEITQKAVSEFQTLKYHL